MNQTATEYTLSEAAFVLDRPRRAIDKAIDQGEIDAVIRTSLRTQYGFAMKRRRARKSEAARRAWRAIGRAELRYLMCLHSGLYKDLNPSGRRRIYQAIKKTPLTKHRIDWHGAVLAFDGVDEALQARLKRLDELRAAIEVAGRDEPVLRGTDIPVYAIAALTRGQTMSEILEDYPGLTPDQVQIAADYATAYPKAGRPYPERSLKRMVGALAEGGAFDAEPGEPVTIDDFR